jgi:hypothetical protein
MLVIPAQAGTHRLSISPVLMKKSLGPGLRRDDGFSTLSRDDTLQTRSAPHMGEEVRLRGTGSRADERLRRWRGPAFGCEAERVRRFPTAPTGSCSCDGDERVATRNATESPLSQAFGESDNPVESKAPG